MDRLQQLEKFAQTIIDHKLLGLFPGKVSPRQLAKEILKELIARKERGVSQLYAPNYFKAFMNPRDYEPILALGKEFIYELESFLKQEAGQRELSFMGPLKVDIAQEPELMEGIVVVEWDFLPDVTRRVIETQEEAEALKPKSDEDLAPSGEPAFLMVIEGFGQGNIYPLEKNEIIIGQDAENDILIRDPLVIEKHAKIRRVGRDYIIEDLDTPSGIFVNLRRVKEKKLQEGDMVAVGRTVLKFHLSQ